MGPKIPKKSEKHVELRSMFAAKNNNCDLSRENVLRVSVRTAKKLFACRLSSVLDRWDAVRMDWVIRSEEFLVVRTAAGICSKKSSSVRTVENIRSKKSSSVQTAEVNRSKKKSFFFRTAKSFSSKKMVIRSKKIVNCSNDWGYPFERNWGGSKG